jgi:PilZ domain
VLEQDNNPNSSVLERRKSGRRIVVHLPVSVTKVGSEGHQVTERTYIEDVSDFGCRFTTRGPLRQGETVSMELLGPDGKKLPDEDARLFEIMWVAPKPHRCAVGARVLHGDKLAAVKLPRDL